jgi:hypothetical protein
LPAYASQVQLRTLFYPKVAKKIYQIQYFKTRNVESKKKKKKTIKKKKRKKQKKKRKKKDESKLNYRETINH